MIFQTERLFVKPIKEINRAEFTELLTAKEIIEAIPQEKPSNEDLESKFQKAITFNGDILKNNRSILGVFEQGKDELIGLVAFLTNNEGDRGLGYRFREKFWNKGYATEITKEMITFSFSELKLNKITADVWSQNVASNKVLSKFLKPVKEFYNEDDDCTDRRYELLKED